MDSNNWVLPLITFVPLLGAAFIMFLPKEKPANIKWASIAISIIPLVISIWLWFNYNGNGPQFPNGTQFGVNVPWIESLGVSFMMGVGWIKRAAYIPYNFTDNPMSYLFNFY